MRTFTISLNGNKFRRCARNPYSALRELLESKGFSHSVDKPAFFDLRQEHPRGGSVWSTSTISDPSIRVWIYESWPA